MIVSFHCLMSFGGIFPPALLVQVYQQLKKKKKKLSSECSTGTENLASPIAVIIQRKPFRPLALFGYSFHP